MYTYFMLLLKLNDIFRIVKIVERLIVNQCI